MQFSIPMIIDSFIEGILFHVGLDCIKGAETEMKKFWNAKSCSMVSWLGLGRIHYQRGLCVTEKSISFPGRKYLLKRQKISMVYSSMPHKRPPLPLLLFSENFAHPQTLSGPPCLIIFATSNLRNCKIVKMLSIKGN